MWCYLACLCFCAGDWCLAVDLVLWLFRCLVLIALLCLLGFGCGLCDMVGRWLFAGFVFWCVGLCFGMGGLLW